MGPIDNWESAALYYRLYARLPDKYPWIDLRTGCRQLWRKYQREKKYG